MRRLGKADAVHLVVDGKVAESFEAPTDNPIERLFYAASVLHCLPVGLSETPSVGTGTVMRPATFRTYARQAGSRLSRSSRSTTTSSASTDSPPESPADLLDGGERGTRTSNRVSARRSPTELVVGSANRTGATPASRTLR